MQSSQSFTAAVLAGSRAGVDPVAEVAGAPCKAVVEVAGEAMLLRVLRALSRATAVGPLVVAGLADEAAEDPVIRAGLNAFGARRVPGRSSPASTVSSVLDGTPADTPVLVTTADHALLETGMVDAFLAGAMKTGADVAIGLAREEMVFAVAPDTRRTVSRFRDGGYCGTNLFAFLTPTGRQAVDFWRHIEANRKSPARMVRTLGPLTLLRYVTRRLTLSAALDRLSALSGARVAPVILPFGRAAIDVDKPEDLELARRLAGSSD